MEVDTSTQWFQAIGQRQQSENDAQHVPPACEEELLYFADDSALEQIVQRVCEVSLTEDIQKLPEQNPEHS